MFQKEKRATRDDFRVHTKTKTKKSDNFSLRQTSNKSGLRVAVVLSKKVAKKAVERNRIKRKITHILKGIRLPKNQTILLYPKQGVKTVSTKTLTAELTDLIE